MNNNLDDVLQRGYRSDPKVILQFRSMKLNKSNNLEKDEHAFPKFCKLGFNLKSIEYKTEPPPNHEKKRKDQMVDFTMDYKRGKNKLEITPGTCPETTSYICGLFVVKQFTAADVISFTNVDSS